MENARGSSGIMKKTKKLMKKKSFSRTSGSMFRVNTVPTRNIATKTRSVKRFSKMGLGSSCTSQRLAVIGILYESEHYT